MDDIIWLQEYSYKGLTGAVYVPHIKNGRWFVVPTRECTFLEFVYLCRVPDEEAVVLKLKYGVQG